MSRKLIDVLAWQYGVPAKWKAISKAQATQREKKQHERARIQAAQAFAQSRPRLVPKTLTPPWEW